MLKFLNDPPGLKLSQIPPPKKPTSITFDTFTKDLQTRNIFIQLEPEAILPQQAKLISAAQSYDYILTYNEKVLAECPNAYKYIYGTTFVSELDSLLVNPFNKVFKLTCVTNDKQLTIGHKFRREVYLNQLLIKNIPIQFYKSNQSKLPSIANNPTLPSSETSKIELFNDSQFSLVIENSRQKDYFTEKLCDCLITKTIPIYYGCPNISNYFDTTGWIILENDSINDLLHKINTITPLHYFIHLDTISKNTETVKKYMTLQININNALSQIPTY
jgi:hypothetical protein